MRARLLLLPLLAACPGEDAKKPEPIIPDAAVAVPIDAPSGPPPMSRADSGIVPEWMNAKADPCTDFFEYACGGFLTNEQIPADRSGWGAIAIVDQRAEDYLHQVLDQAAADPKGDPVAT